MGFIKKALLLSGVPVRPTTKRERFQYQMVDEARYQSQMMEQSQLAAQAAAAELERSEAIRQRMAQNTALSTGAISTPDAEPSDPVARLERLADHSAGTQRRGIRRPEGGDDRSSGMSVSDDDLEKLTRIQQLRESGATTDEELQR